MAGPQPLTALRVVRKEGWCGRKKVAVRGGTLFENTMTKTDDNSNKKNLK